MSRQLVLAKSKGFPEQSLFSVSTDGVSMFLRNADTAPGMRSRAAGGKDQKVSVGCSDSRVVASFEVDCRSQTMFGGTSQALRSIGVGC